MCMTYLSRYDMLLAGVSQPKTAVGHNVDTLKNVLSNVVELLSRHEEVKKISVL
jgi:hypothetical protein